MEPAITQIGKYRVTAVLGQGGMGVVYKAEDCEIRRQVAIKMILADMVADAELVNRFYDEVRVTANLHHPNIVIVYDWGKEGGNPYIVMEFLDGLSLDRTRITVANEKLLLYQQLDVLIQVCAGLQYAHNHAVIHRDVKPANIVMLKDKTVKLVDFGIARLVDSSMSRAGVTRDGQIIGSLEYMSPEQLEGVPVDHRTDVYSSGVVLYRLLTDTLPFHGPDVTATITKILHSKPRPLSDYLRDYPAELDEVLGRALAKQRGDRFQSADEFAFELSSVQSKVRRSIAAEYIAKAEASVELSDWTTAKSHLVELLNIDRGHERANELLREIQQILRRDQRVAEARGLKNQAEEEFNQRHYDEAFSLIEQAVRLDDTDLGLRMFRDQVREAKERNEKSRRALARAESLVQAEELDDALIAAAEALALEPEQTKARDIHQVIARRIAERSYRHQINSLIQEARKEIAARRFTSALELVKRATTIEPGHPEIQELNQAALRGREQERRRNELDRVANEVQELVAHRRFEASMEILERGLQEFANDAGLLALKQSIEKQRSAEEQRNRVATQLRSAYELIDSGEFSAAVRLLESAVAERPSDLNLKATLERAVALQVLREKEKENEQKARIKPADVATRKYETEAKRQRRESEVRQQATDARLAMEGEQTELEGRRRRAEGLSIELRAEIQRQEAELEKQRKEVDSKLQQRLDEGARRREIEAAIQEQAEEKEDAEPPELQGDPLQATIIATTAPPPTVDPTPRTAPSLAAEVAPAGAEDQKTKAYQAKIAPSKEIGTAPPDEGRVRSWGRLSRKTIVIVAAVVAVTVGTVAVKHWWDQRTPPPPPTVVVKIESSPSNAHIRIKGMDLTCETPCVAVRLFPGRYEMEATLDRYRPSTLAVEVNGQSAGVHFILNSLPPPPPPSPPVHLTIRTNPGAAVTLDDSQYKAKTDGTVKAQVASNASHVLHIQKDGFRTVEQILVVAGKNLDVPIRLESMPDAVNVQVKKAPLGASVLVDGNAKATVGTDGTAKFQIPSGTHKYALSTPNGTAATVSRSSKTGDKLVLDNLPAPPAPSGNVTKPAVDVAEVAWNRVKDSTNPADLQGYADRYPASPHVDQARSQIDKLDWESASNSGRPKDYLAKHPDGQYAHDAHDVIEKEELKEAENSGDPNKLQGFLDSHPNSKSRAEVEAKLAVLRPSKPVEPAHVADDDALAIQKVLDIYKQAMRDKNKMRLRSVWPALSDKQFGDISKAFGDADSIEVALVQRSTPVIEGTSAHVIYNETFTINARGTTQVLSATVAVTLKKYSQGNEWYIEKVVNSK